MKNIAELRKMMELSRVKSESYQQGYFDALADVEHQHEQPADDKHIVRPILELLDLRESEPRPAVRFLKAGIMDNLKKLKEEYSEVVQAYEEGESRDRLTEELADVQMVCETIMAAVGLTDKQRRLMRRFVIAKNMARGYYEGEDKK